MRSYFGAKTGAWQEIYGWANHHVGDVIIISGLAVYAGCVVAAPFTEGASLAGLGVASDIVAAGRAVKVVTTFFPENNGFILGSKSETLEAGTVVDRYGHEGSPFVAPVGTPIEMRSLPPSVNLDVYNSYRVLKPLEVQSGSIALAFGHHGLGKQYVLPDIVKNLVKNGYLERL